MQQHDPETADPLHDIYHLAVTGIVTARDGQGHEAVVLGKRGASTFIYPHMWEHAPGGGLESTDIYAQLLLEMEEELGLPGLVDGSRRDALLEPPAAGDVLGLTIDPNTPSVDVIIRARMRESGIRAPAVFFTARINPSDLERYRSAGAMGTLSKPFDPLKLGRQLIQIWGENHGAGEGAA